MMVKSFVVLIWLFGALVLGQTYKEHTMYINTLSPAVGSTAVAAVTPTMGAYRVKVIAPVHSFIRTQCNITIKTGQRFIISRSGEVNLSKDGILYGMTGSIPPILSIGNEVVVAGDVYTCKFTAVVADNSNCDCGWRKAARIVGGTYTAANEFVSHVGLVQVLPTRLNLFCGGTIITQTHVVSAAHCFGAFSSNANLFIFAGYQDYTKSVDTDTPWSSRYPISTWRNHPSFDANSGLNDISIAFTTGYIRFT